MSQFLASNRSRPCPICDDISGKCRSTEDDLILCMSFPSAHNVPGWKFLKPTKNGLWGTWKIDNGQKFDPIQWQQEKKLREAARKRRQAQQRKNSLSPAQRNKYYRELLAQLTLAPEDRDDLLRRGFTDKQIKEAGFKSVEKWQTLDTPLPVNLPGVSHSGRSLIVGSPGYLCPCYDYRGRIVGMQVRFRTPRGKQRYGWLSSATKKRPNGAPPALANGENPLTVIQSSVKEGDLISWTEGTETNQTHVAQVVGAQRTVYLAEGTGAKPHLTASRLRAPVIGAAGGQWASSPETLRTSLKALTQCDPNEALVILIPDAGDVSNHKYIRPRNQRTIALLEELGYNVKVMWWGQTSKEQDFDIDEVLERFEYSLLSVEEFWEICDREKINAAARAAQTEVNALTHKPALELSQRYLPQLRLPKPGSFLFVDSPMGSGKTTQTKNLIREYFQKMPNGLIRFFGYRNALLRQTLENLQEAFPDRAIDLIHDLGTNGGGSGTAQAMLDTYDVVGLCVDSLLKIDERSLSGGLIFLDEVDAVLKHLLLANTLSKRGIREAVMAKFESIIRYVLSTGGYVVAMEANLTDLCIRSLADIVPDAKKALIVNHGEVKPWNVMLLNSNESSALLSEAVSGFRKGLKQVVACDSQAFAAELEGLLNKACPGVKTMRVDGKTSELDEVRSLITNPNAWIDENKPDFLIYTPTLESGADITTKHFDRMLFYFVNLETRAQMQLLGRVREPIPRVGYVKECAFNDDVGRSLRPDVLFQEATKNTKSAIHLTKLAVALAENSSEGGDSWIDKLNAIVSPPEGSTAQHWINAWSGYKARENGARAEMRQNLTRALRARGHRVSEEKVERCPDMAEARKGVREGLQQQQASELADEDADNISPEIAYKILASSASSEKNRRKARKALLADKLPGLELTEEFLLAAVICDRGQFLKRTMQLWDVRNLEAVKDIDRKTWLKRTEQSFVFFPAIRHRALRADLLLRSGVLEFLESETKEYREGDDDPRLQKFFDWCWWNRFEIRRVLGLTISRKTSLVKNLGKFVRKLGYELKSRKIGCSRSKQIRLWRVEQPHPAMQREILEALSRKQAAIADSISTTQHLNNLQAGVAANDPLWKEGNKVRVKASGREGVIATLEPDLAILRLPDGTEWLHPLYELEVCDAA